MLEFWAVIGATAIDGEFRKVITDALVPSNGTQKLADPKEFQHRLRDTHNLCLSRWQVKEIERLLTAKHEEHGSVLKILSKINKRLDKKTEFPYDLDLCAVVGLSCIDGHFRKLYFDNCSENEEEVDGLRRALRDAVGERYPRFPHLRSWLQEPDLRRLNVLMNKADVEGTVALMEAVQVAGWKSPTEAGGEPTACSVGYYIDDRPYWHVNQPKFDALLLDQQVRVVEGILNGGSGLPLMDFLLEKGAISGL